MNCLCNLFDDCTVWFIILALVIYALFCNNCGSSCANNTNNGGCGCGCGC